MANMKLEGFEKLLEKFNQLEIAVEEKKRWTHEAAEEIKTEVKKAAHKLDDAKMTGENYEYGLLEENIQIELREDGTAYVTTGNAYWAIMLEHGTYYHDKKTFFYPAFKKSENRALKKIQEEMKRKLGL